MASPLVPNAASDLPVVAPAAAEPVVAGSACKKAVVAAVAAAVAAKSDNGAAIKDAVTKFGVAAVVEEGLLDLINEHITAKPVASRLGSLAVATAVLETAHPHAAFGALSTLLPAVFDNVSHRNAEIKAAAVAVSSKLAAAMPPAGLLGVISTLLPAVKAPLSAAAALNYITAAAASVPGDVASSLPEIIPAILPQVHSASPDVKKAAGEALAAVCARAPSPDIQPFIPALVSCAMRPLEATETIYTIAATTFVQSVTRPTLAILEPVLVRALQDGKSAVARMCAVIVENMARLAPTPADASTFIPRVLPGLRNAVRRVPDPEARQVIERAIASLIRANGESEVAVPPAEHIKEDAVAALVVEQMNSKLRADVAGAVGDGAFKLTAESPIVQFITSCCVSLAADAEAAGPEWEASLSHVVAAYVQEDGVTAVVAAVRKACDAMAAQLDAGAAFEDDDDAPDLCNVIFSLAYGSKVLLKKTRLLLKRGRRYGLVGPNGSGKSTLMKAIVNGQIEGFPPASELKTVFVECDISPDAAELGVVEFISIDPVIQAANIPESKMIEALKTVGFSDLMVNAPVGTLSGGWRMKLALARAMLKNADILLLDEPTNHLDVANVKWVLEYLQSLTDVTSVIVSHNAAFLDAVITDVIQCDHYKLRNFRGNVTAFCEVVPEAKAYHELKASATLKFSFPDPAPIHGVKTKGKKLLQMTDCEFTYPGTTRKILYGISIVVSQLSRCAVIGPNGAGKSTMIKLLTGEMDPCVGTVYRHPALSLAYVAQHAFHHIENHLNITPVQYILWRYEGGIDKEAVSKAGLELTDADRAKMAEVKNFGGVKHRLIGIAGRTMMGKRYMYEAQWEVADANGKVWTKKAVDPEAPDPHQWIPRDICEQWGWGKVVQNLDLRCEAASQSKVLSTGEVEKHLAQVGLEPEFGTHTRISALSMSQRVKVVLAAATWNNPHIIVLDEPTNYLDRESLGALADAIRNFAGGVVMISHNDEFTSALCTEQWRMEGGQLVVHGDVPQEFEGKIDGGGPGATTTVDRHGNEVEVEKKPAELMTRKERMKAKKMGLLKGSDEDEW